MWLFCIQLGGEKEVGWGSLCVYVGPSPEALRVEDQGDHVHQEHLQLALCRTMNSRRT